jgi:hypothetical protein
METKGTGEAVGWRGLGGANPTASRIFEKQTKTGQFAERGLGGGNWRVGLDGKGRVGR